MVVHFYKSPIAYGIVADIDPNSAKAALFLALLDPLIQHCGLCNEPAVRTAVFATNNHRDKPASEFRGLCERHKQFGMWSDAGTAWGWD